MVSEHGAGKGLPTGKDVLDVIFASQDKTAAATDDWLLQAGEKAPACYAQIGDVISYLDRMASCWWGCRGGDHLVEYLCGRAVAQALSSLRLMRFGLYDEALLACRGVGEIANLLFLFRSDPAAFHEWQTAPEKVRRTKFSPVRVRERLENTCGLVPIAERRYSLLSGLAAHVSPATRPQAHNLLGIPGIGLSLQEEGVLICLNETAYALAFVTIGGLFMLDLESDVHRSGLEACRKLVELIGKVDVVEAEERRALISADPEAQALIRELMQAVAERRRKLRS